MRQVGRGGMGIVYEAEQQSLKRRVALKVLPLAAAIDPRQLRRFRVESQAAAQLHHTNIVPVYAVGCERGVHFYAMQYIEGKTLAELIRELRQLEGRDPADQVATVTLELVNLLASGQRAPDAKAPNPDSFVVASELPAATPASKPTAARSHSSRTSAYFRTVANLGIQAAEALDHAHQEGVIHRDIKPANVMVDIKGHLWITDFGLALLQNGSGLTLSGDLLGTIRYMSPEQATGRGAVVDHRTDIYSLGVTLHELLTLEPALDGQDRREVLRRIVEEDARPLRLRIPSVPRDLETIVMKAIARDVRQRYTSAMDLANDLRRFLDHRPIQARRPNLWTQARKMVRRHRMAVAAIASAILILAIASAVVFQQQKHTQGLERMEHARHYVESIHAAAHMVERCRLNEARQILAVHVPKPGRADIRSFPWFHLWRICNDRPAAFTGHSDSATKTVYHIELSPRGEMLASSGQDGTVRLWSMETGLLLRTLRGHDGDVNWVAFSPDGSQLATGGDDRTVRLWSLSGNHDSITLGKHEDWVNSVLFTSDGLRLISGARDGYVKVWDIARRQLIVSVAAHGGIEGMALSPDGQTLVMCGADGKISLWTTDSMRRIRDFGPNPQPVQSVAFSHDGLRLAAARKNGSVEVWDIARGEVVAVGRGPFVGGSSDVQCVAFSPDDRSLASCGNDGAVRLWDALAGNLLQTYRAEEARLWCVAFTPDGRTLLSCGADGMIRRWDLAIAQDRGVVRLPLTDVQSTSFLSRSNRLLLAALTAPRRFTFCSWDLQKGAPVYEKHVDVPKNVQAHVFSSDGTSVCTLDDSGQLDLWDTSSGRIVQKKGPVFAGFKLPYEIEPCFADGIVAIRFFKPKSSAGDETLVWNIADDTVTTRPGRFFPRARLRDSMGILVDTDSGLVNWNSISEQVTRSPTASGSHMPIRSSSRDGQLLASPEGYEVDLLDARTLRPNGAVLLHPSRVVDLDFSTDDNVLATLTEDGSVRLWDLTTRQELQELIAAPAMVPGLSFIRFSPDGRYLVGVVLRGPRPVCEMIIWPTASPDDLMRSGDVANQ